MADDIQNETEVIKTPTDLALERLSARLDALESENRELREANRGLWASLHPVPEDAPPVQEPERGTDAFESFNKIIGMKE